MAIRSSVRVECCVAAGEDVTVDMEQNVLINHTTGKEYALKPLGDVSKIYWGGMCDRMFVHTVANWVTKYVLYAAQHTAAINIPPPHGVHHCPTCSLPCTVSMQH